MAYPIIVTAPAFEPRSAGITVLHTLCQALNQNGHEACLIFYQFMPEGYTRFFTTDDQGHYLPADTWIPKLPPCEDIEALRQRIDHSIVIYPEVIRGNPLNAKRVVRYVLNTPSYPMYHETDDFIICYSKNFWPEARHSLMILIGEPIFNDKNTLPAEQRQMDCTYIGKGIKYGNCFKVPGSVQLERTWPADKESLAAILRNTRYFYTWDLVSQTNCDALYCGAIVVVMKWHPFSPSVFTSPELGEFPYAEVSLTDNHLLLRHAPHIYKDKRANYLARYDAVANTNVERTGEVAQALQQHFAS
jgi:hypothetical protein